MNLPYFKRGIRLHDPDSPVANAAKAADLPTNFKNPVQAAAADPDAPSQDQPDIRNNLKRFGANVNQLP